MEILLEDEFSLSRIADSGQCFRMTRVEDGYRILHRDHCVYASQNGNVLMLSCSAEEYQSVWEPYFDMNESYQSIRERIDPATDPYLFAAARQGMGIRILRQDPWETLISFIVSQNRNIPAIRRSLELLCESVGDRKKDVRNMPYHAFPTAEQLAGQTEEQLQVCRLGYRTRYVLAAARGVDSGDLDLLQLMTCSDEEAGMELMKVYGVGRKVADCVLLFGFHRLNVFPVDVWIRRMLEEKYPNGYPWERYAPYNGVMQQYLFEAYRRK